MLASLEKKYEAVSCCIVDFLRPESCISRARQQPNSGLIK